ncbi:MAG TPA: hypothetical protein PKY96_16130, partial [Flavobacteriales bacterium]|nr:hypothetical protein [Flavobacteriales bacterium]
QYVFTAQAAGVTDIFGISGATGRQVSWTQYISVPAIVSFQGLPGGATDNAFTTIDLLFNLPIDPASFTPEDISITLGGVPQPGALAIEQINATLFRVSGLENAITSDGAHLFTVDMTGVLSAESEPGIQAQSTTLTRDNTGPVVAELTPLLSGGLDAQHRTGVRIRFSEPVVGLNTSAVSFTRDGQPIILNIAQLSQIDADEWQVTGFGLETYPDGDYLFAVSATGITDAIGNAGTGSLSTTWNVDRSAPITVTGVNITPDLGISNSDGITSTLGFDALFNLSAAASQVTISQTSFGSEQVLLTLQNLASGPHAVPLSFPTGGNTGLKVTAIGANGGSASGTKSLFIDQAPLSASWQTANNQSLTSDLVTASLQFSAAVLDPGAIQGALSLWKNGQPASTASLTVTPVNSTTYSVGNLPMAASGTGTYELRIDASALNKATSGIAGNSSAALNWTVVPGYTATLRARVFLEGPYAAGAMHDSLRSLIDFPLTEPFTALGYAHVTGGGETISPQVLASPGNDAIVDWVLVELRDANDNTSVVASRCALVQRDGDVVATDGLSPVTLGIGAGAYHVAIRHRNHLGTMTADTARFYSGVTQVDFTLLSTQLYGTEGQKQMGARRALWAGDVNFNSSVQYVGEDNDRDPILVSIGGSTPTSTANGYLPTDVNLDGRVKYVGERNDRDPILVNVGGSTPTNIREAQLPQP